MQWSDQMTDPIADLEAFEATLVFPSFDQADAWRLGNAAVDLINEGNYSLAIEIVLGGYVVFKAAIGGVSPDTDPWLKGKAAAARFFDSSSMRVRLRKDADPSFLEGVNQDIFRTHGGSVPIRVTGQGIVGTITASGEPDTVDHAVAIGALQRLIG